MDWEKAYREHHAAVFGYLYRHTTGNRELARDLAQDVFVRAMDRQQRFVYDDGRGVGPWLMAIAKNLLLDHFKKGSTRRETAVPEFLDDLTGAVPGADHAVLSAAVGEQVRAALTAKCNPQDREALVLRFWGGYDALEIARLQRRSHGAVKTGECRAKQAMRHSLRHLVGAA